jgi:hypothetical protein
MTTYTAQVGPDNAKKLAAIGGDPATAGAPSPIESIGSGTVQINDIDRLRKLTSTEDGSITEDDEGLQIWIGGEGYPLFDAMEAATAEALGLDAQYVEAKRGFDRASRLRDAAIANVVTLAGSPEEAAKLLDIDATTIAASVTAAAAAAALAAESGEGSGEDAYGGR